jgi:hypothetical protein
MNSGVDMLGLEGQGLAEQLETAPDWQSYLGGEIRGPQAIPPHR